MAQLKDLLVEGKSRFIDKIYASDQFISKVVQGTSPFLIDSSTLVSNLNADLVDGQHFNYSNTSNSPTYLWGTSSNGTNYLVSRASMHSGIADKVSTIASTSTGNFYLTFVDSNNTPNAAEETLYTSAKLYIQPSTGNIVTSGYIAVGPGKTYTYIGSDSDSVVWIHNSSGYPIVCDGVVVRRSTSLTTASLGSSSVPWPSVYGTNIYTRYIEVDSSATGATAHIKFNRANFNYLQIPTGGTFAVSVNGSSGAATYLAVDASATYPGYHNKTVDLGTSSYSWKDLYIVSLQLPNNAILEDASGRVGIGTKPAHSSAKGLNVGDLLVSNAWADRSKVPTNGIYSKGQIKSGVAQGTAPFIVDSSTVVAKLNADLLDGQHLSMIWKHGYAYPYGKTDKPWHLIGEYSQSNSTQINASITFFVAEFYSEISYGILTVRARSEASATTMAFYTADWSLANNINVNNFVITWKCVSNVFTLRIYCKRTGWSSYAFRKIEEQSWGTPIDVWILHTAQNQNEYCLAAIPSDETQVVSNILAINNSAPPATHNHDDLYLKLAGGWMNWNAQIYFKGLNNSTSVYSKIGYATSASGQTMHCVNNAGHQANGAFYITSNGSTSANDTGGLAIDNEGVTVFGAGDAGSNFTGIFRVLNEDNVADGPQFIVTKASGATTKYSHTAQRFISTVETGTQPYACTSTTLNTHLNADLLDDKHADEFLFRLKRLNLDVSHNINGMFPPAIFELKSAGYPLFTDPEFASGNNSFTVYNNSQNGTVTITREQAGDHANSSGYQLKIVTAGTASPNAGGFYQSFTGRANAIFVQIIRAKVPLGYNVNATRNSQGTGNTYTMLTDNKGTGKWEWYAVLCYCGTGGSFSNAGFIYLSTNGTVADVTNTSVTWYVSYANVFDITKGNYDGLRTRYADSADSISSWAESSGTDYRYVWHSGTGNGAKAAYKSSLTFCPNTGDLKVTSLNANDSTGYTKIYPGYIQIRKNTAANPTANYASIEFSYGSGQNVYIGYTPNDSYRAPAGLKVFGGSGATPAWFEVEGQIISSVATGTAPFVVTSTTKVANLYANKADTAVTLLTNNTSQAADNCYDATPGLHFYRYNGTSSTTGQSGGDGWILQWSWNKNSVGQQLYVDDNPSGIMCIRGCNGTDSSGIPNRDPAFTNWWRLYTDAYHPLADSATTASKLGTSNVGAADRPIYLAAGVPTQTTYRMAGTNATATTAVAISSDLDTGIWYVNGTGTTDLYNISDGVAYVNKYSNSWIAEIYQDYRTGQIAVRGKNNGTWQSWRKVFDSVNYTSFLDGTYLKKVTVPNNAANDFNAFGNMTLTGRGDPTTGASLSNAPWTGAGPAGGYGVLTYLWSGYGTQLAFGYNSNKVYIRNKYYYNSGANWSTTWDSLMLTSDASASSITLSTSDQGFLKLNGTTYNIKLPATIPWTVSTTDKYVEQSETTTANYRGIVLGYNNNAAANTGITTTTTNVVYTTNNLTVQPSTGNIVTKGYVCVNNTTTCLGADSTSVIWLKNSSGYPLVATGNVVRRGASLTTGQLGDTTYPWAEVHATKFRTANYELSESTNNRLSVGNAGQSVAKGLNVGDLLVSSAWADYTKVPTNGIYSKGQIKSGVAQGTAPFAVDSSTKISNLNADLVDGYHNRVIAYGTTASPGGYYKIKITWESSWMLSFTIRVYQSYEYFDIVITGYNYGSNHWYQQEAVFLGGTVDTTSKTIYFGYDGNYKLWVAFAAASYTGILITDICNGYTQQVDWSDKFTIVNESELSGTTQSTQTVYRPYYRNEEPAAATVKTVARSTNATHYLTFVDSNNSTAAQESIYTSADLGYNPSTGVLSLKANQYTDSSLAGSLNLNNSNIYGINSLIFSDACENGGEGIQFYRDATHADTIWDNGGVLYYAPNRTYGTAGTSYKIWHEGNDGSDSGLDADKVDGFHAESFEGYYKTVIDASALDGSTWYPVVMSIGTAQQTRIRVEGRTNAPGAWNTRSDKLMALTLDYTVQGSSWGWVTPVRYIWHIVHGAGTKDNLRGLGQLTNSSTEYVYVRGGAVYNFYLSRNITPSLKTETYTVSSQSVAPTTTAPAAIVKNTIDTSNIGTYAASPTHNHDSSYVTLTTDQEISGAKTFQNGKWIIKASESNEITTQTWSASTYYKFDDSAVVNSLSATTNSIKFRWYNDYWNIGIIRGSSSESYGFAIGLQNSAHTHLLDAFRVNKDGKGYLKGVEILTKPTQGTTVAMANASGTITVETNKIIPVTTTGTSAVTFNFTWNSPATCDEAHVIITGSGSSKTITIGTVNSDSTNTKKNNTAIKVTSGGYGEISIVYFDSKYFIRAVGN